MVPLFVHGFEIPADMPAARELEQHHRPLGGDEGVATAACMVQTAMLRLPLA